MSSDGLLGKLDKFTGVLYVVCAIVSCGYFADFKDGRMALIWVLFAILAVIRFTEGAITACFKGCNKRYVNLGLLVLTVLLFFYIFTNPLQIFFSTSPSMVPTIHIENVMIVDKTAYLSSEPERNDIVLLRLDITPMPVIHRIIALPNDTVEFDNGVVTVNGEAVEFGETDYVMTETIELAGGMYYHKGDNANSLFGVLALDQILGKVIYIAGGEGK